MKECTKCKVVKPLDAFSKRKNSEDGLRYFCKQCSSECAKKHYLANKERIKAGERSYRKSNIGKCNAKNAKRRASRLQATPKWANLKQIEGTYKLAQYLTEEHGRQIHVDHIVPLQNPLVCGLHVEDNLQLLYADENLSKSNKFEVTV